MLGLVQLTGATRVFSEDVVDVFEGLFEHGWKRVGRVRASRCDADDDECAAFEKTEPIVWTGKDGTCRALSPARSVPHLMSEKRYPVSARMPETAEKIEVTMQ